MASGIALLFFHVSGRLLTASGAAPPCGGPGYPHLRYRKRLRKDDTPAAGTPTGDVSIRTPAGFLSPRRILVATPLAPLERRPRPVAVGLQRLMPKRNVDERRKP